MPKFNDTKIYGDLTVTGSISGNIATTTVSGLMSTTDKSKLDSIDEGAQKNVDLNTMAYFDYAGSIYGDKYSLLVSAWEHSLTVDASEISVNSSTSPRGTAQYPNGTTEGVIIPQGVTTIGSNAFDWWSVNNQPLVIPNSVTSIGSGAFSAWMSNNQKLIIPTSLTSIGTNVFAGWWANNHPLVIPNSVTSIGSGAFSAWQANNQPLIIPNSVTSIGNNAFYNWNSNNQPLVIPNSVTSIGSTAFRSWELVPYVEIQAITPPTLANADAFDGQDDAPIYVPDNRVAAYKAATNWVELADRIFSINDKQALNFYTKTEIDSMVGDIESALDAILE